LPASLAVPVSQRFHDALSYASTLHARQSRKGGEIPYVAHLLAVASIVMEAGGDEDEAIAAVLHDGPEDQGGEKTLQDIRDQFGDNVADIVGGCSDTFEDPKPLWEERKRKYIEHLQMADCSTLLVSAADKVHNARATLRDLRAHGAAVWDRFSATREQTLNNYRQLISAYEGGAEDKRRLDVVLELRELVDQMENV
jgi:(p)ppGpp synthase/HD superfamily hydrolase